jgi:hypothetical protein
MSRIHVAPSSGLELWLQVQVHPMEPAESPTLSKRHHTGEHRIQVWHAPPMLFNAGPPPFSPVHRASLCLLSRLSSLVACVFLCIVCWVASCFSASCARTSTHPLEPMRLRVTLYASGHFRRVCAANPQSGGTGRDHSSARRRCHLNGAGARYLHPDRVSQRGTRIHRIALKEQNRQGAFSGDYGHPPDASSERDHGIERATHSILHREHPSTMVGEVVGAELGRRRNWLRSSGSGSASPQAQTSSPHSKPRSVSPQVHTLLSTPSAA